MDSLLVLSIRLVGQPPLSKLLRRADLTDVATSSDDSSGSGTSNLPAERRGDRRLLVVDRLAARERLRDLRDDGRRERTDQRVRLVVPACRPARRRRRSAGPVEVSA
jgi:hypothetical protein